MHEVLGPVVDAVRLVPALDELDPDVARAREERVPAREEGVGLRRAPCPAGHAQARGAEAPGELTTPTGTAPAATATSYRSAATS